MRVRSMTLLSAIGITGAASHAQVIFSDDFSSGTDAKWSHLDLIGGTSYSVVGGRYEIESVPLPALPFTVATGSGITDSVLNPSLYADGLFRATVRLNNADTSAALVARTDAGGGAGYSFAMNNVQDIIGIAVQPDPTTAVFMDFTITEGVDYIMEASFFGMELSLKVWAASDPEPLLPQLSLLNTTWAGGGYAALAVYNNAPAEGTVLSGSFDNVSFAVPAPGLAPIVLGGVMALGWRRHRPGATGPQTGTPV